MFRLTINGTNHTGAIIDKNTYRSDTGKTLITLVNGMAGNIESHSTLEGAPVLNVTAVLNYRDYGFSKLTFHNATTATWRYIKGSNGEVGDELTVIRADTTKGHGNGNGNGHGGHGGYGPPGYGPPNYGNGGSYGGW